jgi:autotransporter-associated beta strand protein
MTVKNGIDDALSTTGVLRCNPDTVGQVGLYYNLNGFNQTLAGIAGAGPFGIQNTGASVLTINTAAGTDYVFGGQNQIISGGTAIVKTGDGIQRLGYTGVSGAMTYSGGTTIKGGVLEVFQSGVGSGAVTITNGGVLQVSGSVNILDAIHGDSTGFINLNSGILTQTVTTTTGNFGGSITNAGSYVKAGSGTQILSGANTYSGATTVKDGKLVINGSLMSEITVNSGATLGGTGTVQAVTLDAGAILAAGNSPGTMTFDGALILLGGSTNKMEIASGSSYDILQGNGNDLTLNGVTEFDFSLFVGVTNGFTMALTDMFVNWNVVATNGASYTAIGLGIGQDINITGNTLTVIPEPATVGMLGLGAFITILLRRIRTR